MQEVFNISQWEWEPHIQHNCKLDDLRAGFEITERYWFRHGLNANIQHAVGQGGLFWQSPLDASEAARSVLTAVSEGELTPIEATRVMGLIDSYRRTLELTEIEERLQALEEKGDWTWKYEWKDQS